MARVQWAPLLVLLAAALAGAQTEYTPWLSPPRWVIYPGAPLPAGIDPLESNNCVGIHVFDGLLFIGWRSAPFHFASTQTSIYIMSSPDMGQTWQFENKIHLGSDAREPHFIDINGQLIFTFFQAGTDPVKFQPQKLLRIVRKGLAQWTEPEEWGTPGEIAWQLGVFNGSAFASSYIGDHYSPKRSDILVYFNVSDDGFTWRPLNVSSGFVYEGGVSEVGWTFDDAGNLYAVMRNEDGDTSGFGSRIAFAEAGNLGSWQLFPESGSNPFIFESPRMFTHANQVYLVARRDVDGPFQRANTSLPYDVQKYYNLATYSLRAHTTALWRINKQTMELEWIMDLPGCGDTAFPSIVQIGPHTFLIANYTSPLKYPGWSWIHGQISKEGTQIYFIELQFLANTTSASPLR